MEYVIACIAIIGVITLVLIACRYIEEYPDMFILACFIAGVLFFSYKFGNLLKENKDRCDSYLCDK